MRAALLTQPGTVRLDEVVAPVPAGGDVLIAPTVVGICGTDKKIHAGGIQVSLPRVMGHEIVGTVAGGSGTVPAGTRVIVDPSIVCGHCARCLEGRSNICERASLLGRDRDGGLAELLAVPAANVYPLPDAIADEVAPLIQVLTTCVHAQRAIDIFPSDTVVVLGLGVTGLLHLQLAKRRGATVIGVTRSAHKLALAAQQGADSTIAAGREAVTQVQEGGGADVVIECAGTVDTLGDAVRMARPGGRILAYGTIADRGGNFPYYDLYYKELAIANARASCPEDFPMSIASVAEGAVALDALVTDRFTFDRTGEAFEVEGGGDTLKVVVTMR